MTDERDEMHEPGDGPTEPPDETVTGATEAASEAEPPEAEPPEAAARAQSGLRRLWGIVVVPLGAVILAMVAGSVVILASQLFLGTDIDPTLPLVAYAAMIGGGLGSFNGIVETLVQAAPLVLAGLAVGVGFKAGLFNIGAQGQFLIGALATAYVGGLMREEPAPIAITLAVAAGILGGLVYGFIPGALKALTGAHEVVTTIMLNFVAISIVSFFVSGPLRVPQAPFALTIDVKNAHLPIIFGRNGHLGLMFALLAVPLIWWLLWRAKLGFEIRLVGANPEAARFAGTSPRRLIALTMALCGALAGLAGAGEVLGRVGHLTAPYATNVGFDAIAVALLGRANPVGILFAGLLLGTMKAGAGAMQIQAGIPVEIVDVIQGLILLFLAAEIIVRRLFRIRQARGGLEELATVTRSYGDSRSTG